LNVNTDLSFFNLIMPCGITSKPVTSMERELGREIDLAGGAASVSRNFGTVFSSEMHSVETPEALMENSIGVPMKAPQELRAIRGQEDLFLA